MGIVMLALWTWVTISEDIAACRRNPLMGIKGTATIANVMYLNRFQARDLSVSRYDAAAQARCKSSTVTCEVVAACFIAKLLPQIRHKPPPAKVPSRSAC